MEKTLTVTVTKKMTDNTVPLNNTKQKTGTLNVNNNFKKKAKVKKEYNDEQSDKNTTNDNVSDNDDDDTVSLNNKKQKMETINVYDNFNLKVNVKTENHEKQTENNITKNMKKIKIEKNTVITPNDGAKSNIDDERNLEEHNQRLDKQKQIKQFQPTPDTQTQLIQTTLTYQKPNHCFQVLLIKKDGSYIILHLFNKTMNELKEKIANKLKEDVSRIGQIKIKYRRNSRVEENIVLEEDFDILYFLKSEDVISVDLDNNTNNNKENSKQQKTTI